MLAQVPHKEQLIGACSSPQKAAHLPTQPTSQRTPPIKLTPPSTTPIQHPHTTASLAKLLAHLAALRFGDRPDYDLCLALFDAMAFPGQEDLACLPPPAFDWLGEAAAAGGGSAGTATSGYQRAKQEEAGLNAGARQLLLSKQVLALCDMDGGDGAGAGAGGAATGGGGSGGGGKGKRDSLGFFKNASPPPPLPSPPGASSGGGGEVVGTAGAGGGLPEIELARMWARVGRRLVEQEAEEAEDGGEADAGEEGVARRVEQLVKCLAVARRHGTFFLVDGLTEREFADIQLEAVYGVERAYSR